MLAHTPAVPIVRWIGVVLSLALSTSPVAAGGPKVAFDFGRTAECRDVTAEYLETCDADDDSFCGQKVVEFKLRVSVHLLGGKIQDVEEVRVEIGDCDSRIRVKSYSPDTRLQSDFAEAITVTKTTEHGNSVGGSLGGELPVPLGDVVAHVVPSVNGGLTNREVLTEKQTRVAPHYAVVASGTIKQEHGVFFKLRSSPQTTLEGSHELSIRFLVPKTWRADSLRVCCYATGQEKFLWTKQQTTWSSLCAPVAIYLAGDSKARLAAEEFVAQATL